MRGESEPGEAFLPKRRPGRDDRLFLKAESSKKLKKQQETATRQKETGKAAQKHYRDRKKTFGFVFNTCPFRICVI